MSKQPHITQRPCDCTVTFGDDRRDIEAGIAIPCDAYRRQQQEALAAEARAARLADLIAQGSHKADIDLLDALEELHATKAQLTECTAAKDGAYLERNQVVAALAKCFPSGTAQTPIEGWSPEWFGCVYIDLPTGQASWHFHTSQAYLFAALPPYAGEWDGHSTPVKYERLDFLKNQMLPQQQAELACMMEMTPKGEKGISQLEPSPTAGMNIAQRILHVGGRNNAAGYVEFGSTQAVEALVRQVLRDLPSEQPEPTTWSRYVAGMIGCYLKWPEDDTRIEAVAGIIERRRWAQAHAQRLDDYATEINRLRNVVQAACSGGLDHMIARWAVLFPNEPVPTVKAQPFKVTEEQHVAACKVLLRAHGMAGLPQRMVDAMLAVSEHPSPSLEICGNCDTPAPGCDGLFASDGKACKFHGQGSTTP